MNNETTKKKEKAIEKIKETAIEQNKKLLETELENREELQENPEQFDFLYPSLDDPNFNIKIAQKKEFSDTKYDAPIENVETYSDILGMADYELLPQQAFVRNFLSFQTPYNSLLLFHGLGSGKTCSAIGVSEEMKDYLKQMGINKKIIIVASPNVQDNFRLQIFDERKLKEVDGIWSIKGCLGNKLLKEINPTGMKGLKREKVIQQVKNLINATYSFKGYGQFSNEIVKNSGNPNDSKETKIRNLEHIYSNSLIVIDEVHNIRISDNNENKNIAKNLMYLVKNVSNIRLLLLSATPMFNNYREIVWLLNLMNMNDRRAVVSVSDIFDKNGNWTKDKSGNEVGRDLLIRKATGYVSYVRGENPYTFPFRVYPDRFSPQNTFTSIDDYPKYQLNGVKILDANKIQKLSLFLTNIGEYQRLAYNYIMYRLRTREEKVITTRTGAKRQMAKFNKQKAFGYTDLQIPIQALIIVYPYDKLDELTSQIKSLEFNDDEVEQTNEDNITPLVGNPRKYENLDDDKDEIISAGLELTKPVSKEIKLKEPDSVLVQEEEEEEEQEEEEEEEPEEEENQNQKDYSKLSKTNSISTSTTTSFKDTLRPKTFPKIEGMHIIEGKTQMKNPKNTLTDSPLVIGGGPSLNSSSSNSSSSNSSSSNSSSSNSSSSNSSSSNSSSEFLFIDPKDLVGTQGLKRVMNYIDSKTPSVKGEFEYRPGFPHIFSPDEIGKYSSKIKNVCDYIYNRETDNVSSGIILIYSQYIDAGIIPMALALEEMGFTRYGENTTQLFKSPPNQLVDVRTMKPPENKKKFKPARYVMITGDSRISPNNDDAVKALTSDNNISGEAIKVVLISQAGSEGLDFKAIRQVHILDPWYNLNRIEQIIGRAVRNFSHKDLPFKDRNVQIFLYGTTLNNEYNDKDKDEETADLYIYRMTELKAIKIGKVTRLLKQTAVDCIINHDQTELVADKFKEIEANRNIVQELSDHQILDHFEVGDVDNSVTCDFMKCEFKCLPNKDEKNEELFVENSYTYNEPFMLVNSDKIIQKIKELMKIRYFYKRKDLLDEIRKIKDYPLTQIYSALTQIITDNTEYITDKYGRTGYLVNIGDYYLFQPSELNYKNISIYERSVPIDYKHNMIKFEIKTEISKPVIDEKRVIEEKYEKDKTKGKHVLDNIIKSYMSANLLQKEKEIEKSKQKDVEEYIENDYKLYGRIIKKMAEEANSVIPGTTKDERLKMVSDFLIEHIVDCLMMNEKIDLLNYIYANKELEFELPDNIIDIYSHVKRYLVSKLIVSSRGKITGIVLYNGPSSVENLNVFVVENDIWGPASPEDKRYLDGAITQKYALNSNLKLNNYVGFIGFETNGKYMVYKIKDTDNKRTTGFRCDQAGKIKTKKILEDIKRNIGLETEEKESSKELCIRQEFMLKSFEYQHLNGKIWFLDTETAIFNEFEKKEKK